MVLGEGADYNSIEAAQGGFEGSINKVFSEDFLIGLEGTSKNLRRALTVC
jgi:hypothetical protein